MNIVSFERSVLERYKPEQIKLNDGAGVLNGDGWDLQIDASEYHVSTFLYKLASIPEEEIKHFQSKNIHPKKLSPAAYRRWVEGMP